MRRSMTWHRKAAPKWVRWVQCTAIGAVLLGVALFALHFLGLPYGTAIERSETRGEREPVTIPPVEGRSQARVEWGN
jgi:hypothetical protein